MNLDSSEEISIDLLNENETHQSPSYSIKRMKIIFMQKPFWSLLYSRHTGKPEPETLVGPYEKLQNRDPSGTVEKLEKQDPGP